MRSTPGYQTRSCGKPEVQQTGISGEHQEGAFRFGATASCHVVLDILGLGLICDKAELKPVRWVKWVTGHQQPRGSRGRGDTCLARQLECPVHGEDDGGDTKERQD